jgi:GNAT superfamily N-acetyltransferase
MDARIRAARRTDAASLVELRIRYLADMARLEPRYELLPDVRQRTEHALPVWMDQEDRVLLVAEDGAGNVVGYATGLSAVWPPVLKVQHVGEVSELYVVAELRGQGVGRALLEALSSALRDRGARVLRAVVPSRGAEGLQRFEGQGYRPVHYVLEKGLGEA